jgi:hypothetical protein
MKVEHALNIMRDKFEYRADRKFFVIDSWSVLKERSGSYFGDCDDFALTTIWLINDESLFKFLWNTCIVFKHRLHKVRTESGGHHIVAQVGDLWFDNWTKKALSKEDFFKETKHKYSFMLPLPLFPINLIRGYFNR